MHAKPTSPTPLMNASLADTGQAPNTSKSAEIGVAVFSLLWLGAGLSFFLLSTPDVVDPNLSLAITLAIVICPLCLIWTSLRTWKKVKALRAEVALLQQELAQIQAARRTPPPQVTPANTAQGPRGTIASPEQQNLAFDTAIAPEPQPINPVDFIRAMQFPESAEDHDGIQALQLALTDPETAKLIRAAQDILTLLSQESVYMDDLAPELCSADLWRRFADGERGQPITAVGGIRDRASLAITLGRIREDAIFRDTAHHFLRMFDKVYQGFEANASDEDIIAFSDTRTARAFMLVGRASGVFD